MDAAEAKTRSEEEQAVLQYLREYGPASFSTLDAALGSPSDRVIRGRNRNLDNALRRLVRKGLAQWSSLVWKVIGGN